jgi:N-acyl amino acid synthase of PEP-CTERM/exosortase system
MYADNVGQAFRQYFQLIPASTDRLREEAHRIRYEVYCRELAYENADAFPDRRERDPFDPRSLHCLLLHRPSGQMAGCVRLILADRGNPDAPFPFELASGDHLYPAMRVAGDARLRTGEISRLAVLSSFRRRQGEHLVPEGIIPEPGPGDETGRRVFPHIALGLYLASACLGLDAGLESAYAMMEPRLARRLQAYGIAFRPVGEVIEYHGRRGPFQITREDLFGKLPAELQALLAVIRDDLANPPGTTGAPSAELPLLPQRTARAMG